jgi:hypothetical protein
MGVMFMNKKYSVFANSILCILTALPAAAFAVSLTIDVAGQIDLKADSNNSFAGFGVGDLVTANFAATIPDPAGFCVNARGGDRCDYGADDSGSGLTVGSSNGSAFGSEALTLMNNGWSGDFWGDELLFTGYMDLAGNRRYWELLFLDENGDLLSSAHLTETQTSTMIAGDIFTMRLRIRENRSSSNMLVTNLSSASFNIQPVPVPAAAWLFAPGLIGLVGIARRKKA